MAKCIHSYNENNCPLCLEHLRLIKSLKYWKSLAILFICMFILCAVFSQKSCQCQNQKCICTQDGGRCVCNNEYPSMFNCEDSDCTNWLKPARKIKIGTDR
jgi:hypothetical protein